MACGEWLSAQAEEDCHAAELKREAWHLQATREEAAHMRGILMAHGLSGATADAVNRDGGAAAGAAGGLPRQVRAGH